MIDVLRTFFAVIGIANVVCFLAFVAITWVAGRERRGEKAARQIGRWR